MSGIKVKPHGESHSIANVFLPFLDDLRNHPCVTQVGYGSFIDKGGRSHVEYEFKNHRPDKHSITVVAYCPKGQQQFYITIEPYEALVISEVTKFIESY